MGGGQQLPDYVDRPDGDEERWPENIDMAQAVGEVTWLRVLRGPGGRCAEVA